MFNLWYLLPFFILLIIILVIVKRKTIKDWLGKYWKKLATVIITTSTASAGTYYILGLGGGGNGNDIEAYIWHPSNGYGTFGFWEANKTFVKQFLKNNMDWRLQASNDNISWFNTSQFLNIKLDWTDDNCSYKITLTLNTTLAPESLFYRFDLACNKTLKDYMNHENNDSWVWNLIVPANNTTDYTIFFDWSDVKQLVNNSKIWFDRGVKDNFFWFRIQSVNKIHVGTIFVVDPSYGVINPVAVSTYEYGPDYGMTYGHNTVCRINNSEYYVSVASGDSGTSNYDGYARTLQVYNNNGTINNSVISIYEYDTVEGRSGNILHIPNTDIYVLSASGSAVQSCNVYTLRIWDNNGTIQQPYIDKQSLVGGGYEPQMINITDNVYLIIYTNNTTSHGIMETVWIDNNGTINNTLLDLQDFTNNYRIADLTMVDSDTIAITYCYNPWGGDYNVTTYNVSSSGIIDNTYADNWLYESDVDGFSTIDKINTNTFVVTYCTDSTDCLISKTFNISDNGIITKSWIDTLTVYDGTYVVWTETGFIRNPIIYGDGVMWLTVSGVNTTEQDGHIFTYNISSDGTIGNSYISWVEFDTADNGQYAGLTFVNQSWWLIVYSGTGSDGFAKTYYIETVGSYTPGVPTVTTNSATGVTSVNVTLRGILNDNGSLDTTCYFLWGENSSNPDHNQSIGIIGNGSSFELNIEDLKPATNYYFNTKANNSYGWDNSGGELKFFTTPVLSGSTKVVLNNTKTFVQTISATAGWTMQTVDFSSPSFGVPDNAIAVLCLVNQSATGSSDFVFTLEDYSNGAGYWMRSSRSNDNSYFSLAYLRGNDDKKAHCFNAGTAATVGIYMYGYIIETNGTSEYGTEWNYLNTEQQILTNGDAVSWTNVNSSSYISGTVSGVWVSVTTASDQTIYFRQNGSSEAGILVLASSDSPQHLLIPTDNYGAFQYYTSSGSIVNIYLLTYLKKVNIDAGDRFLPYNNTKWTGLTCDSNWHSLNLTTTPNIGNSIADKMGEAKFVIAHSEEGVSASHTDKMRKSYTSNVQNYLYIGGCGRQPFIIGVNESFSIDYWFSYNPTDLAILGFIYPTNTIASSVDTITPYWQDEISNLQVNATVDDTPDNVTLYYRYSNDNISFDPCIISYYDYNVTSNLSDNDSSADIGTETDFPNCKANVTDNNVMTIAEINSGGAVGESFNDTADGNSDTQTPSDKGTENNFAYSQDITPDADVMTLVESNQFTRTFTNRTETYVQGSSLSTPFDAVVNCPSGTTDGDILFTHLCYYNANARIIDSVPSGWIFLAIYDTVADKYALYYKIASSEPASYTWSFNATVKYLISCHCYYGNAFDTSNPIDVISNTSYRTSDTQCNASSMTVTSTYSPLLFFGGCYRTSSVTFTKPSVPTTDWDEDYDYGHTTPDWWKEVCSMVWSSSGATGDMVATMSASFINKHAFAVALNDTASPFDYELDQEYQFTGCNYTQTYEQLCIYTTTNAGENLTVAYWSGVWTPLGNITGSGWFNFTATGLTTSYYNISVYDQNQTDETTQTTWSIDCLFLHCWNDTTVNYMLNFEYNWTGITNYSEDVENISIYVKAHTGGSETLNITYWGGASWLPIGTITSTTGWKNFTINGLEQSYYTIRINGTSETADSTADTWTIDCMFIRTGTFGACTGNCNWTIWNNASNPDLSSPWNWTFNFPNSTGYYEFYSITKKSGYGDETAPLTADSRCHANISISGDIYQDIFREYGEDYIVWLGTNNTNAYIVNLSFENVTWSDDDYIAIWNSSGTWNSEWYVSGLWYKYYPWNQSGNNWTIKTMDVIKTYITMGSYYNQTINMTVDESVDYGSARVIPLTNTTNNKGYNYTSHNCVDYTDLQSLNASIGLDAGEGVGVWNRATFTWTMWISELGITNSQVNRWDVVITKVQDSETYTTCW